MEDLDRHKAIPILFGYIDEYERGGKFEADEFINYFENVLSHLKLVRDQNNLEIVKGVDDTLISQFDKIPFTTPGGGTDIRYFSAHILATFFPVLIPMSAQFQEAYKFCLRLRQIKTDLDFMESELTPYLFDKSLLKRSPDLRYYFLTKVAEMHNLNHDPILLDEPVYQNLDKLREIPPTRLLLSLKRRHLKTDSKILLQDKFSPEYKLLEFGTFFKMAESNLIYQNILYKMGYLKAKRPFADRLKQVLSNGLQFITGIIKVPRYILFIFNRSRFNYIYITVTFILLLIIMISIFQWIGHYNAKKLSNFEQKIESLK